MEPRTSRTKEGKKWFLKMEGAIGCDEKLKKSTLFSWGRLVLWVQRVDGQVLNDRMMALLQLLTEE
jgi:hypothetical protein